MRLVNWSLLLRQQNSVHTNLLAIPHVNHILIFETQTGMATEYDGHGLFKIMRKHPQNWSICKKGLSKDRCQKHLQYNMKQWMLFHYVI